MFLTRFLFQAAEAERLKRVEQQRKELLEKVFIEQIRKQKEVQAEQYYQQQNQLLQLQRLHQLKLMQDDLHHGPVSNGRTNTSALDAALASRAAAAGIPITISSGGSLIMLTFISMRCICKKKKEYRFLWDECKSLCKDYKGTTKAFLPNKEVSGLYLIYILVMIR